MTAQEFLNWRTSLGLTQKQVATLFGLSEVAIYKRESGKVAISPETDFACRYLAEHFEDIMPLLTNTGGK